MTTKSIDLIFLLLASLCMLAGAGLGIAMGIQQDFQLRPVHAHINLLGWTSLALYGVCYRAFPGLGGPTSKTAHLLISGAAAVLFPIGLAAELTQGAGGLVVIAAPLWMLGAVLFAGLVLHALVRRV